MIGSLNSEKKLHVYDSFEGLPATGTEDTEDGQSYTKGDLATSEDVFRNNFRIHDLELPGIHKGWFDQTLPQGLSERICFAHLDECREAAGGAAPNKTRSNIVSDGFKTSSTTDLR